MTSFKMSRLGGPAALLAMMLAGCSPEVPDMTTPPPPVGFVIVAPTEVRQTSELPGRVSALRTAEIRPQVSGIVQKRMFEQGAEVRAGQPLFQINAAPFKADAGVAAASLQRAEAALARATTQTERLKPLVKTEAISQQAFDDAESQRLQALADVAQAKAELSRRTLDLRFATIDAPISGRIDQAQVSEGALVNPGDSTPLARIQQIDQVYVDVRQPAASLDALLAAAEAGRKNGKGVAVQILRSDGSPSGQTGKMLFSGVTVDEGTGDVLVRILVENSARRLLPGMFVRTRLTLGDFPAALAIPQQAVARKGEQTSVWVVGAQNKVHERPVEIGELVDRRYIVRSGLQRGDKLVVEGLDRMTEGAEVTPSEWRAAVQPARAPASAASAASNPKN